MEYSNLEELSHTRVQSIHFSGAMSEHTLAELRLPISPAPDFDPGDPDGAEGAAAGGMGRNAHHLSVPRSPLMHLQVGGIRGFVKTLQSVKKK